MQGDLRNGFRLGDWRAYPLRNVLAGPRGDIHIEPKVMQVLERLARSAGQVVGRDELLADLWDGRAMSDEPLTRCIATLRRVLDDSAREPRYIQTIPKRGYRLVCPVTPLAQASKEDSATRFPARLAVATIALVLAAAVYWGYESLHRIDTDSRQAATDAPPAPERSIAILPFTNLSAEPDNEYLSDGLATELSDLLTTIPDLKVAARTSAFAFKGEDVDISEIGRQLRVAYLLSGSVRQSGERLRISAQLVDVRTGYHAWSGRWERRVTDIFEIQDEIAAAVVDSLRLDLLGEAPTSRRADPEAYALYLKSKHAASEAREPDLGMEESARYDEAMSLLAHALAIDPDYAPAWGLLAGIQVNRAEWAKADRADAYARAKASAERALSLDPNEPAALNVLGAIADLWEWDSEAAAMWYRRVRDLNPRSSQAVSSIAVLLGKVGLDALPFAQAAYELDPLHVGRSLNLALSYKVVGKHEAASQQLEIVRTAAPDAVRLRAFEALFAYLDGDFETSVQLAHGVNPPIRACALQAANRLDEARAVLEEIRSAENPHAIAEVYACWNEVDTAYEWLERAYEEHDPTLRHLRHPMLANLRDDPRWEDLARRVGISDADAGKVLRVLGDLEIGGGSP